MTASFQPHKIEDIQNVEELPGANPQGETLEKTKANLIEAIQPVLRANRELAE